MEAGAPAFSGIRGGDASRVAKKGEVTRVELTRNQQTAGRRVSEAKATIPHLYLRAVINMSRAVEMRLIFSDATTSNGASDIAVPTINDMIIKATASALCEHPGVNSAYRDGGLELYSRINISFAVAAGASSTYPTITDADQLDFSEIAAESRRLSELARSGEITQPDLSGGTFSVSNLGMFGVGSFDAVIHGGQAAILAVGEIAPDGEMQVTLSCDHRILNGVDGARLLATIKSNLEEPELMS